MELSTHLSFNGQCEAAFKLYEQCFGGKIAFMLTWGDSPMKDQAPPGWEGKIFHATLVVGKSTLAGADLAPPQYEPPKGFSMMWSPKDPEEAERVFNALAEGGTIQMPLQQTFWSVRFGCLVDRFGIPWEINCEQA